MDDFCHLYSLTLLVIKRLLIKPTGRQLFAATIIMREIVFSDEKCVERASSIHSLSERFPVILLTR